jgi:hypothetical protein
MTLEGARGETARELPESLRQSSAEAAAVTAIMGKSGKAPIRFESVPFRDRQTGTILFLGRMARPA